MRRILQELALLLLFTTPVGYLLGFLRILNANNTSGIYVQIENEKPLNVYVRTLPLPFERLRWITYGIILVAQGLTALLIKANFRLENLIVAYMWFSFVFGFVNLISGIFPKFPWNKRPFKISVFEVIFIASIIIIVALFNNKP